MICPKCGRNLVYKSGRFGRFLACPGWPECDFTMPLVVEMPGKCPKCGGRLLKRTGKSKKTNKQYTYYCCEHLNSKDEARKCDFMTWDVPVKDNCPECGWTMFKKSGRGFKKPFCIHEGFFRFAWLCTDTKNLKKADGKKAVFLRKIYKRKIGNLL